MEQVLPPENTAKTLIAKIQVGLIVFQFHLTVNLGLILSLLSSGERDKNPIDKFDKCVALYQGDYKFKGLLVGFNLYEIDMKGFVIIAYDNSIYRKLFTKEKFS